jgi:hypothetical protein
LEENSSMNWLRPSPALIVSVIALVVSLGGTGYAALRLPRNSVGATQIKRSAVGASELRRNAITSSKVRNHSLTGADIKLSALGTVPSAATAATATTAATAANANALEGHPASDFATGPSIRKIDYRATADTPEATIFNAGGLTLTATCTSAGALIVVAATSTDHAVFHSFGNGPDAEIDNFRTAAPIDVHLSSGLNEVRQIVYSSPAGPTVTIEVTAASAAQDPPFGGTTPTDCLVSGIGVVT